MSKRALLIGIDYYQNFNALAGCVNDARALLPLLARNEDSSLNLQCRIAVAQDELSMITRDDVLEQLEFLLAPGADFSLLYFAGHGSPHTGGDVHLVTSDGSDLTPGVRFTEVLEMIKASAVQEIVVVLDCCFSGAATTTPLLGTESALVREGVSILTASRRDQVSAENFVGRGQFSTFLEGGLDGGAADVLGNVTIAGLYAYLSEMFGAWEQRPTFKANVDRLHYIRSCQPRVDLKVLRELATWFPSPTDEFKLDPSFEPTEEPRNHENEAVFASMQKLRAAKLLDPVGEDHMYYAAMNSKSCALTPLGRHYWSMVAADLL